MWLFEPIRIYYRKKVTTVTNSFEVVALLSHICPLFSSICPLFSHYHLDRSFAFAIPACSTVAYKYIEGYLFVRSSYLLHSTHACCYCVSIVERPLSNPVTWKQQKIAFTLVARNYDGKILKIPYQQTSAKNWHVVSELLATEQPKPIFPFWLLGC